VLSLCSRLTLSLLSIAAVGGFLAVSCSGGPADPGPGPGPGGPTWRVSTVDSNGSVGQGASLEIVQGFPAISYADDSNFGARYVRASNADGTAWGVPVQVATGAFAATDSTALEVIAGNPAIAFQRGNVKYVRAEDPAGSVWGDFVPVGSTNGRASINLLTVDGSPVAVFQDPNIESVRASDPLGDSWPTTALQIDTASRPVSAAIVGGRLAVAYTTSTGQLVFRRTSNAAATAWGSRVVVNSEQFANFQPSLAVVDTRPAISYVNGSELRFIRAVDTSGGQWPAESEVLDSAASNSGQTSLAVVAGVPAVAYSRFPGAEREVWYTQASNASGTAWGDPSLVDSSNNVGESLDLQEVNGRPAIAYYDATAADLKYAVRF
jgi:hypothetical protein